MENNSKYSIVMAGDSKVGKSSIIRRFTENNFLDYTMTTIGVDVSYKTIKIDGKNINLKITDTAGQERFKSLTKTYYKHADSCIFVYDITSPESLCNINRWIEDAQSSAGKIAMIIIGNKCDQEERKVSYDQGKKIAMEKNIPFLETSAKYDINIVECFELLSKIMINIRHSTIGNNNVTLDDSTSRFSLVSAGPPKKANNDKENCCN